MQTLADLGISIAGTRKATGLAQRELAHRAGVSRSTIDLLENGRATDIGYSKLIRILAALGLELKLQPMQPERPTLDDLLKESIDD